MKHYYLYVVNLIFLNLLCSQNLHSQSIIYVDGQNGNDTNTGNSWSSAVKSIHQASALYTVGDQVWIKGGTYHPDISNRSISFLISGEYYGGFDGTEITLSDRDLNTTPTVLSGDLLGNDINIGSYFNQSFSDNSITVVNVLGNSILDGFTITGGYSDGQTSNGNSSGNGAAIYIGPGRTNVTLSNCVIEKNIARGAGAGIYSLSNNNFSRDIRIERCIVDLNIARLGAGIYHEVQDNTATSIEIVSSLFSSNQSSNTPDGNGIFGSSAYFITEGSSNASLTIYFTNNSVIDNLESENFNNLAADLLSTLMVLNFDVMNINLDNNLFYNNRNLLSNTPSPLGYFAAVNNNNQNINISASDNLNRNGWSILPASAFSNTSNTVPSFVDYQNDDFRLASGSVGIDGGSNNNLNLVPGGITLDLNRNNRISGSSVDIGAYEFDVTATVNDANIPQVQLFPNPVNHILRVNCEDSAFVKARLYNLQGQLIKTFYTQEIYLSKFLSGIYLLQVEVESGDLITKKIVKN